MELYDPGQASWLERQWFDVLRDVEDVEVRVLRHYTRHDERELWAIVHQAISTRQDPVQLLRQIVAEGKAHQVANPTENGASHLGDDLQEPPSAPAEPLAHQLPLARTEPGKSFESARPSGRQLKPAWAVIAASGWAGRVLRRTPLILL
jgi:hypothetical protein